MLFGDDYGLTWRGVVRAVNRFAGEQGTPAGNRPGKVGCDEAILIVLKIPDQRITAVRRLGMSPAARSA